MIKPETISIQIYKTLRREILEMVVKPGEKLSEAQLAEKYQTSRAPVRYAIQRLEQEKLVQVKPQIGTIVAPIQPNTAKEICQVRLLLEPFAASVAAKGMSEEQRENLKKAFEDLKSLPEGSEEKRQKIFETDLLLHRIIWKSCGNSEIYNILKKYSELMNRIRLATAKLANRLLPSEQEMNEIYQALMSRDSEKAQEAMVKHISNIRDAIEGVLAEKDN